VSIDVDKLKNSRSMATNKSNYRKVAGYTTVKLIDSTIIYLEESVEEVVTGLQNSGKGFYVTHSPKPKPRKIAIHACHVSNVYSSFDESAA